MNTSMMAPSASPPLVSTSSPLVSTSSQMVSTSSPMASNSTISQHAVWGCGAGLDPAFSFLCDRHAVWGLVLEGVASLGFLLAVGLLLWTLCTCAGSRRRRGGPPAAASLFLFATAGLLALTFALVVRLTPRTCPVRLFLFAVLFALALGCLVARGLALQGFAAARGWGEPAIALGLSAVQVVIGAEWLLVVLVRDGRPCEYRQEEFAMLQIYVLCLLATGLLLALSCVCRACRRSRGYASASGRRRGQVQAALLLLALLLSAAIWVAWITLLTWGNERLGRRPHWDDPVLGVALVANGWVFLLCHGLAQVALLCRDAARAKEGPLSFQGWISPSADIPGLGSRKEGRENGSFEDDRDATRGRRAEPVLQSPYESGFTMTEIDPGKDYSIPRPQTTNISQPYDEYYRQSYTDEI